MKEKGKDGRRFHESVDGSEIRRRTDGGHRQGYGTDGEAN